MKFSKVTTAPTVEPFTVSEANLFLRLGDNADENTRVTRLIKDARQWCEDRTNRSLIKQVRSQYQDTFYNAYRTTAPNYHSCIELLNGPLFGVVDGATTTYVNYIKYYDEDDVLQTLDSSEYWVDTNGRIPRVWVKDSWPTTICRPNAIEISYNAGFGDTAASIPGYYMDAMEMYIAHFFENRVPEVTGVSISQFEMGIERLLEMGTVYQNAF